MNELRRAWAELIDPKDYETHMAAIGQAEANAHLIMSLIEAHPLEPDAHLLFAGAGTGQMFDYVSPDFLKPYRVTFSDIRSEFLDCITARLKDEEGLRFQAEVGDVEEPQPEPVDGVVLVLVLEHVNWRKAIDELLAARPKRLYVVIQVNPRDMTTAVSPNRVLPKSMAAISPEAKPELIRPNLLKKFLGNRRCRRLAQVEVAVADGKTMLGIVFDHTPEPNFMDSLSGKDRELFRDLGALNLRGHAVTERAVRRIFDEVSPFLQGEVARFLTEWRSRRGLSLAQEWLQGPLVPGVAYWALSRLWTQGIESFDWFVYVAERKDVDAGAVDDALDLLSDLLWPDRPRYEEGLAFIARYLDHPSGEVRWTALFSLAKHRPPQYRPEFERMTTDTTLTRYGYVSGLAKQALRLLDDEKVDLHDAEGP